MLLKLEFIENLIRRGTLHFEGCISSQMEVLFLGIQSVKTVFRVEIGAFCIVINPAIEGKAKVILRHLFGRITGTSDSGSFSRYDLELEVAMAETIMWISFLWNSWSNPIRLRLG